MTYDQSMELVQHTGVEISRESWNVNFTGHRLWMEGKTVMKPTRDWPQPYYPSNEDKAANDWVWHKKETNESLE